MTGNGIIRLKIKKAKNPAATINGYVFFDVGPKQNPFEVARDMVKSLSPGDIWNVCLIANDSGTIDTAIFVLLCIWMLLDRFNVYLRK